MSYQFIVESEDYRKKSYQSPFYKTLKDAYKECYRILKNDANSMLTCAFIEPGDRNAYYDRSHKFVVLTIYGIETKDYRIYADGVTKLIK